MKLSRVFLGLGCATLLGLAVAQTVKLVSINIAGKDVKLESVVVQGKTFVSLEQLKKAFPVVSKPQTVPGGTNQVAATQGCIKEFLFNGAWRFRVLAIAYDPAKQGWLTTVELRNGMKKIAQVRGSGADNAARDISLALASGNVLELSVGQSSNVQEKLLYKQLAPGAATVVDMIFYADSDADKPRKFLWVMSAKNNVDNAPLIKDPAFRIDLTCIK